MQRTNHYVQEFTVREIADDLFSLRIQRSDPDLELSDLEFFLDYQEMIKLLDTIRSALK